jgi:hypothetical protein
MAARTQRPGVIHLAGRGGDIRCLDMNPVARGRKRYVGKLCGLAYRAEGVAGLLDSGLQMFSWDDIEWIHFGDPAADSTVWASRAGGRRAE